MDAESVQRILNFITIYAVLIKLTTELHLKP